MTRIKFESGPIVDFDGDPTPEDIEEVESNLFGPPKDVPFMDQVRAFPTAVKTVASAVGEKVKDWTGVKPFVTDPGLRTPVLPLSDMFGKAIDVGGDVAGVDTQDWWKRNYPKITGTLRGGTELTESLSTPENLGLMYAFTKLPLALKNSPKAARAVKLMGSGGFAGMMASQLPGIWDAIQEARGAGDQEEVARLSTLGAGQLLFTVLGLKEAGQTAAEMGLPQVKLGKKPSIGTLQPEPIRMGTPEEMAIKTDLLTEKPPVGPDRMLPALAGAPLITPPPVQEVIPPERRLEGPVKLTRETNQMIEAMTGKPVDALREQMLVEENALKGVEMSVKETDLPSPALSSIVRKKFGDNPDFMVPGIGIAGGAERLAMAAKKLSGVFGVSPGLIADAATQAVSKLAEGGDAMATASFWSRIPLRAFFAKMGLGTQGESLMQALKEGDPGASKEIMDMLFKSDPALGAIFPKMETAIPLFDRLKASPTEILEGRAGTALPGQVPGPEIGRRDQGQDLRVPPSERTQPQTELKPQQPSSESFGSPEAGATVLFSEAAGRILDLAKKSKDFKEFRALVASDVDLNDTAKFYGINLRQYFEDAKKGGGISAPPPPVQPPKTSSAAPGGEGKFAGNINLSKYRPEIQEGIRKLVEEHPEVVDRAKISDESIKKMADVLQSTPGIDVLLKKPQGELAAEAIKIRRGEDAFMRELLNLDPQSLDHSLREILTKDRTEKISKVAYEFGRALASMKIPIEEQLKMQALISKKIKEVESDPKLSGAQKEFIVLELNKRMRHVKEPQKPDPWREYFLANILSNPITHYVNLASTSLFTLIKPLEKGFAAIADTLVSGATGKREHFFGEIPAQLRGLRKGFSKETKFETEEGSKIEHEPAIPGKIGRFVRAPLDALKLEDEPFKRLTGFMEAYGRAYAQARKEGLKEGDFAKRVTDLLFTEPSQKELKPGKEIYPQVAREQLYRTFQIEMGKIGKAVSGFLQQLPLLKYIQPFLKSPENIVKRSLERTPIVGAKIAYRLLKKEPYPQFDLSQDLGNLVMATTATAIIIKAVNDGVLTGQAPSNADERAKFYQEGKKPNAVKIGNKWFSYMRYAPIGTAIATIVNPVIVWKKNGELPGKEKAEKSLLTLGNSLKDQSFFSGLMNFVGGIAKSEQSEKALKRFVSGVAGGMVPYSGFLNFIQNQMDQEIKNPGTIPESIKARIPVLSESVRPKLDQFGEDVLRPGNFFERFLNLGTASDDPVVKELERLDYVLNGAPKRIQNQVLTQDRQDAYMKSFGPGLHEKLETVFSQPFYRLLPNKGKLNILDNVVDSLQKIAQFKALEGVGEAAYEKIKEKRGDKLKESITSIPLKLRGRVLSRLSAEQKESLKNREFAGAVK